MKRIVLLTVASCFAQSAWGADTNRRIIAEVDPVAPASAAYNEQKTGVSTSKWGGDVDFNVAGKFSTGPEFWIGTFAAKGEVGEDGNRPRREDLQPGETHKIDATRLRWTFTMWERPDSMRGWFVKGGYSYLRVNSRAKRIDDHSANYLKTSVDDETDYVTDIRHGAVFGFGNRWCVFDQSVTITLGATVTGNYKRSVIVDSKDPDARADYDDMIEELPDTRMSVRPTPEANLSFGYAF